MSSRDAPMPTLPVAVAQAATGQTGLRAAIATLTRLIASPIESTDGNADLDLLRCLHETGRHDLPLGRLFEGHVDAQQIVGRYADAGTCAAVAASVECGAALGVWNADLAGEGLRLHDGRLSGGKAFASGAGILSHALVTAEVDGGRQLVLVELAAATPAIDRSWWRTIGMRRSETHLVRWDDAAIDPGWLIGRPDDYQREPWFSGGALRFVAVQAGGVAGLCDRVRDHLVATGRADDPHQQGRLAELFGCADLAAAAVRQGSACWRIASDPVRRAQVAAARMQVAALADRAITVAQQAVGLQGMFHDHPLAAALTDLTVYLRQPAPDAQRMLVGQAVAAGLIEPRL